MEDSEGERKGEREREREKEIEKEGKEEKKIDKDIVRDHEHQQILTHLRKRNVVITNSYFCIFLCCYIPLIFMG